MNKLTLSNCADQVFVTLVSPAGIISRVRLAIDNSSSRLSARLVRERDAVAWPLLVAERCVGIRGPSPPGRVRKLELDAVGNRLRLRACGFAGSLLGPADWTPAGARLFACRGAIAEQARSPILGLPAPPPPSPILGYLQPDKPLLIELDTPRPFKLLFERGGCLSFETFQASLSAPSVRSALNFNAPGYQERNHFALDPRLTPLTAFGDVEGSSPIYMIYPSTLGKRIVVIVSPWQSTVFINQGAIAARTELVSKCLGNVRALGDGVKLRFGEVSAPRLRWLEAQL